MADDKAVVVPEIEGKALDARDRQLMFTGAVAGLAVMGAFGAPVEVLMHVRMLCATALCGNQEQRAACEVAGKGQNVGVLIAKTIIEGLVAGGPIVKATPADVDRLARVLGPDGKPINRH
jgi:hypothetical protein